MPEKSRQRMVKKPLPSISSPASEFLGKIKYLNTLPEVPVEAMFLTIPLDLDRYVPYRYSSLEKNTKNDISYSIKDTIPLPLVDLSVYPTPEMATRNLQSPELLHPADLLLLSLGAGTEVAATDSKRDAVLSTIATDFTIKKHAHANFNFKQSVSRFSNAAHSMPIKEFGRNMTVEKAKEVIEQTFLDAQHDTLIKLEHPLTPELTVKKILPVLPDRASWPDELSMFIFDSLPFTKGSWNDKRQDDSSIAAAQQQHGVCLFSTPNILQNFTISSDPSLIHLYSKPNDSVSTANDGMEIDQTTLDYQRTFSFIKKPEEKQAFSLLIKEDQVNYHPIVQKVVLKLHRPSKQQSKGTRCKSIPPVILLSRREENFDELQSRQEILRQLDSI